MSLPPHEWFTQQSLPGDVNIGAKSSWPDCLLKLQSRAPGVLCNISSGPHSLRSGTDFTIKFELVPSPIGSYFMLELSLYSPPKNATAEQQQRNKDERMYAIFSTYDPEGDRYANRRPYNYTSKDNNTPPAGPLSFSQQLYDVCYSTGDAREFRELLWTNTEAGKQICFSWRSIRCHKFAFSRPLQGLSNASVQAARTFRQLIDHLLSAQRPRIMVVAKPVNVVPRVYWPWFAAIPAPVPESYWPWLYPPNVDPGEVMQFPPNRPFERSTQYVDVALAKREKGWWNASQPVTSLPSPLEIAHLDSTFRFLDPRQYVAYVLGAHGYEEVHAKGDLERWFNGRHTCDVFPETASRDRPRYMVLLNIRPPRKNADAETTALPEAGERVDINITLGLAQQTWTGRVVRIPSQYARYGRNVAIVAEAAPYLSGLVQAHTTAEADFHFGHYGSLSGQLRTSILNIMLKRSPSQTELWMRNLLLGHDNYAYPNDKANPSLPNGWKQEVDAACNRRSLNAEQVEAVRHYFTHLVTIVRGPPGTGKSTLVDTILELESKFRQKTWVCTESNAAVDILATKVCKRLGTMQPLGMLRVKPAFEETLTIERHGSEFTINALEAVPQLNGQQSLTEAIDVFLRSSENVARAMSLEATIKLRMSSLADIGDGRTKAIYAAEYDDLVALRDAYVKRFGLKMTSDISQAEFDREEQRLERKYLRTLRNVQAQYVSLAMAVFSTAAATSGQFIGRFAPAALIMDEASQFLEANAVFPILHALSKGSLCRILLIGDDDQLPPTLMAPRNPFLQTGVVSLFERLIKTGLRPITLREQYRMHPDISRISATLFARGLRNGPATSTKDGVAKFRTFMSGFASRSNVAFTPGNAVVISPVQDQSIPWGSQRPRGSNSRINLLSARMIMRLVYDLVNRGNFVMSDIIVIAFYKDQVGLLEALFESGTFRGLQVKTIDKSQGCEAPIVIVDCVTLGSAANESMGFLGAEQRRFNVAMTRAQVGRIVISHKDMIQVLRGKRLNSGAWNEFFDQAKAANAILDGHYLNERTDITKMEARFDDVRHTYERSVQAGQVSHSNVKGEKNEQTAVVKRECRRDYGIITFIEATGATQADAVKILTQARGDLAVAINDYFSEHGSALPVEEI
jgi:predicted RNA-binding protein